MANRKKLPEINASSMADIAFLLLIFFLVTTTMDVDKGLMTLLPPYSEEPPPETKQNKRNVLDILVNSKDMLLVKGKPLEVAELKELCKRHVNNNGVDPDFSDNPGEAVVSLKSDRGTSYDIYITVQNELKAAYNELRDDYARGKFGETFTELKLALKSRKNDQQLRDKLKDVREAYPLRISEAEPENFSK